MVGMAAILRRALLYGQSLLEYSMDQKYICEANKHVFSAGLVAEDA